MAYLHNDKLYMDLSAVNWTFNGGAKGFTRASRPGFDVMTNAEKIQLVGAVNAAYANRHPNEPQLFTGYELHAPNEVTNNKRNWEKTPEGVMSSKGGRVVNRLSDIKTAMEEFKLDNGAMVTPNNHHFSTFRATTSHDRREQEAAYDRLVEAFEIGKELGAKTIVLWQGAESYSNPYEGDMQRMIEGYAEGLISAAKLAVQYDMFVAVEPKPFEPGDELLPNNSGQLNAIINDLYLRGDLTEEEYNRLGANDESGHVVMANVCEVQNFALNRRLGKNLYAHLNRQFSRGKHDTDNEIIMSIDMLGTIDQLSADEVFMSKEVRRFAGFDYQWRHHYTGQQGLHSLYANGLRLRALQGLAEDLRKDSTLSELRENHRYSELDSYIRLRLAEASILVNRELMDVGKEGIKVPKKLEKMVNMLTVGGKNV